MEKTVSFRSMLIGEVVDFLETEHMSCVATQQGLVDLIVALSAYQEEGKRLYPTVLICDNVATVQRIVQGTELIQIGKGPRSASTIRLALKKCAPLGQKNWFIFIERRPDEFSYGLIRNSHSLTSFGLRGTMLTLSEEEGVRAVLVSQLADKAVELIGATGGIYNVFFSSITDKSATTREGIEQLVKAVCEKIEIESPELVKNYFRSTLFAAFREAHGALVVVVPAGKAIPKSLQDDGTVLSQPIALAKSVEKYIKIQGDIDNYYELSSYAHLIGTMIACDGIAVFSSDGSLMAYNVFFRSTTSNPTLGGARHRTYDGLCSLVDQGELTAAFILSSDGHSKFYARKNDGKF